MAKLPPDWIESTPEWKACFGLIDGDEYLQLTAHYGRVITDEHRAKLVNRSQCMPDRKKGKDVLSVCTLGDE